LFSENREKREDLFCGMEQPACPRAIVDITFLIGIEPFTEIFPTRANTLAERSPVFRAMLEGPLAEDKTQMINIRDVDPRAFEILISFMTGDAVKFQSVPTALAVIYAARKYMVKRIDDLALKFIYKNISVHNVLLVLQHLLLLTGQGTTEAQENTMDTEPSAPPLAMLDRMEDLCYNNETVHLVFVDRENQRPCQKVIQHCFSIVDEHAKVVLESDEWEELSLELVRMIISRDSLAISSELTVFMAVNRWSHRQCRRRHLEPTPENKRFVLQGAQFLIRFLTMTTEEFKAGQASTRLLTPEEEVNILYSMVHIGAVLPKDLQEHRLVMMTRRKGRRSWKVRATWLRRKKKTGCRKCPPRKEGRLSLAESIFVLFACLFD